MLVFQSTKAQAKMQKLKKEILESSRENGEATKRGLRISSTQGLLASKQQAKI